MKKLSILLIGLLVVAGLASAQEITMEGDATLTIGIDLDGSSTGFLNESTSSLSVAWDFDDAEKGSEGFINLSGMAFTVSSEDTLAIAAPSVEAGWMFDPVTIKIWSGPSFAGSNAAGYMYLGLDEEEVRDDVDPALAVTNASDDAADPFSGGEMAVINAADYAEAIADADYDGYLDDAIGYDVDGDLVDDYYIYVADTSAGATEATFNGVTVTADLGVASVDIVLGSDGDWTQNGDNGYAVGLVATVPVDPVSITAGVWAGPTDALDVGFTLGASGAIDPVSFAVGFDGWMPNGGALTYDASVDIGLAIAGIGLDSLTYLRADVSDLDEEVVLDLSGLVPGLTFTETFQMPELITAPFASWYSLTNLGYDTMSGIAAALEVGVDNASVIDIMATVTLTGFVENTTFELKWDVDDIGPSLGVITASGKIEY